MSETPHVSRGESSSGRNVRAVRSPLAVGVFLAVVVVGLAVDLLSKHYVFQSLLNDFQRTAPVRQIAGEKPLTEVLPHIQRQVFPGLRLTLSTNPGVVFGRTEIPHWGVILATFVTIFLVFGFFATSPRSAWLSHVSLGLILAGALGNLYDRLFSCVLLEGFAPVCHQVRDFIDCSQIRIGSWNYPYIFNIADIFLVIGVGLLIISWFFNRPKTAKRSVPDV